PEERRNLGAHYTSEKNILKLIKPLFLDELQGEFQKIKGNKNKLKEFHQKLGSLKFLDPACGCGNFLIITYRELRLLELEVLKELYGGQQVFGIDQIMLVDVDQFFGIEYDEFPARIAEVALWLMDHQMNLRISEAFGMYYARLPLKKSATIVHGNALRTEWTEIVPKAELSYILGNPPFYGSKNQTKEQKEDMKSVFGSLKGSGVLDYVTAWYLRAAQLIQSSQIECAFVSTNSITQGEQVAVLWNELLNRYSIKINFAHRTFNWKNEAKGNAAVHVVIIGFAIFDKKQKRLFEYSDIKGEPHEVKAKNINPYLVDASNSVAISRSKPLCSVQEVIRGSETTDSGNFMLSEEEKNELLKNYPQAESFVRTFQGGGDIINNRKRYCLWLRDVSPATYRNIPLVMEKIQAVKDFRLSSKKERTRKWAEFPTLFSEDRQPENNFLVIPKVSSERRKYVPIAYLPSTVIINNTASALPNANLWYFGIITSLMHMTWLKYTCGRMKSDYIYSIQIVYNNYPWPKEPSDKNKKAVETKAKKILDVRTEFPESSLADLYDPLTMPPKLVKAHQELDKAVDLCYRPQAFTNETARIEFLFDLYNEYTMPLLKKEKKTKKK
ncbi:MAG: class I SAM-dependent DNA methyltransferase, partial [Bacteroidetes bacterium]|nr:class I SAM-dependent DNA methyltransferase [Bacteroidota bacterium]